MNTAHHVRSNLVYVFWAILIVVLAFSIPSPLHEWFATGSVGGVPANIVVIALTILFTPPAVLSTILRKFDVDYDDEDPAPVTSSVHSHGHDIVMHLPF